METKPASKPPTSFWVVSGIAVIWMLFGVMAWVMDLRMDDAALAQMSDAQRQVYASRPQWLFAVYAIAVFGGLIGAIGLLLRRQWSIAFLAISLVAIVVQFGYTFVVMDTIKLLGAGVALPFPIVIFAIGAFLLWFARRAKARGWIA